MQVIAESLAQCEIVMARRMEQQILEEADCFHSTQFFLSESSIELRGLWKNLIEQNLFFGKYLAVVLKAYRSNAKERYLE